MTSVVVVVPSYGEGEAILFTLDSIGIAMKNLGLGDCPVFLSDSSPDDLTVLTARKWASSSGLHLVVDRSLQRRSLKEALNAAFEHETVRSQDIVVEVNADVVITTESLRALLGALLSDPDCVLAAGMAAPDPSYRSLRHRAGAWQLAAAAATTRQLSPEERGVDGVFWAARGWFTDEFRFAIGSGSIHDDVELSRALLKRRHRIANVSEAKAYKVPTGSLRDFVSQTTRWQASVKRTRGLVDVRAATQTAISDPLGLFMYCLYRVCGSLGRRWLVKDGVVGEAWARQATTFRSNGNTGES